MNNRGRYSEGTTVILGKQKKEKKNKQVLSKKRKKKKTNRDINFNCENNRQIHVIIHVHKAQNPTKIRI